MSNLFLRVEAHAGADIEASIKDAKRMAIILGLEWVEFVFHGIDVAVYPNSDVKERVKLFNSDMQASMDSERG